MDVRLPEEISPLAIFPLPEITLFPHALLPLHIFEPRYREMTAHALAGSRILAITRIRRGHERTEKPPVDDVAGVGHIIAADKLPDGRYNLMLRGIARVKIGAELPMSHLYREVTARRLVDDTSSRPSLLSTAHQQLMALCDQLARVMPEGGDSLRQLSRAVPTPGGCADLVASAMLRDPDERQRLLETLDPADRLEQMIDLAASLLQRYGPGDLTVN
jgi:Lon protease-like protein